MSVPYIGEIRLFGFRRIPEGWQACDGSLLAISNFEVLYTLLGTTYGGDGQVTFAVPDLRGRVPLHQGTGPGLTTRSLGEMAGTEEVTLLQNQIPAHNHAFLATTLTATQTSPATALPAALTGDTAFINNPAGATPIPLDPQEMVPNNGNLPHDNLMPTLTMSFCIAYVGIYPQQS